MRRHTAWALAGIGLAALAAALLLRADDAAQDIQDVQTESSSGRAAVVALTSAAPGALSAIPRDFESELGYRPVLANGRPADPRGDCSSPVPLPAEFGPACAEHDLGYDLLRYSDRVGQPLEPWARVAIDRRLGDRLESVCWVRESTVGRGLCLASAEVADVAVDVNTWRQRGGVPGAETAASVAAMGAAGLGALVLGSLAAVGVGSVCRRVRFAPLSLAAPVAGGARA
jgi:hypothetical protein